MARQRDGQGPAGAEAADADARGVEDLGLRLDPAQDVLGVVEGAGERVLGREPVCDVEDGERDCAGGAEAPAEGVVEAVAGYHEAAAAEVEVDGGGGGGFAWWFEGVALDVDGIGAFDLGFGARCGGRRTVDVDFDQSAGIARGDIFDLVRRALDCGEELAQKTQGERDGLEDEVGRHRACL